MALPIRDGNQSLTTLSTILVSNSHIPAHTVISFGTQGITDIATAVSGVELGPNTLSALENITVTLGQVTITGGLTDAQLRASAVTIGGTVTVGSIVTHGVTITNSSVTIGGSVTATISGTSSVTFSQASVTFGTAVVTGSTSILNFPATQTVTFTQASVTFSQPTITGSVSVLNFPASQSVTFSQASVTFGTAVITGSTSIIGTPSVTFTQIATHGVTIGAGTAQIGSVTASISGTPSVTFGTAVITGSASILNFPATQTVTFTQASVTFGTAVITGSASIIGTPSVTFTQIATHGVTIANNSVTVNGTFYQATQPVSIASVTIGNSITISSLPAISGTVTANGGDFASQPLGSYPSKALRIGYADDENYNAVGLAGGGNPLPVILYNTEQDAIGSSVSGSIPLVISGTVTANLAISSTAITSGSFASLTSATLVPANTARKMATVYNLGAGQLFVNAGATATTLGGGFMVALSAGDFYECNYTTTTLSAIFATAGTASWMSY